MNEGTKIPSVTVTPPGNGRAGHDLTMLYVSGNGRSRIPSRKLAMMQACRHLASEEGL